MDITNVAEFGNIIRQARKGQGLTQAELAAVSGLGVRFIVDLERGKPTCQLAKALHVAATLGLRLWATTPGTGED